MAEPKDTPSKVMPKTSAVKNKGPSLVNPATLVTIYAGNEADRQKFIIHKDFATHYSPVLKAAFNSGFIEGQTQIYVLEDTTEDTVRILIHWMYTQKIDLPYSESKSKKDLEDEVATSNESLVKLWILADKLIIPRLQNAALHTLDKQRVRIHVQLIGTFNVVFRESASDSLLQQYMVQIAARHLSPIYLSDTKISDQFPKEMLIKVLCLVVDLFRNGRVTPWNLKDFDAPED